MFFVVVLKFKYLAHEPFNLFSKLSFAISIPKTKDNPAPIHFGKSPALPQAKSIRVLPFLETPCIIDFLTYRL